MRLRAPGATPAVLIVLASLILLSAPAVAADAGQTPPAGGSPEEQREQMSQLIAEQGWEVPDALADKALGSLFLEVGLLVELDAFSEPVPRFEQIHQAFAPWPAVPRAEVVQLLIHTDNELAAVGRAIDLVDATAFEGGSALDQLPEAQREQLVNDESGVLPPSLHTKALSTLLSDGALRQPLPAEQPGAEWVLLPDRLDDLAEPRDLGRLRAIGTPTSPNPTSDGAPSGPATFTWILVALIGAAGAIAGVMFTRLVQRRQNAAKAPRPPDNITDEIFEAHRLLTRALNESEVGEIGCRTAISITGAHDAVVFRRVPEGLRATGSTVAVVDSVLDQVVKNAQPLITAIETDPAYGCAASICAVPLVNDGAVEGVLLACSSPGHPLDDEIRRRLGLIAPALAGALANADALGSYAHLALVDGLTSLGNRRRLDSDLESTIADATDSDVPLGFAMIDVDHFKIFNDTYGHEAGDQVLQTVAQLIEGSVRSSDVVYRYGGEEFSVLLPGATRAEASQVAERIRLAVESATIPGEETQPGGRLTISVGVATLDEQDPSTLKTRADEALYLAKAEGRNRITFV